MSDLDTATSNHVHVLKQEIEQLKFFIDPTIGGQGHIHTAISVLEWRVRVLEGKE